MKTPHSLSRATVLIALIGLVSLATSLSAADRSWTKKSFTVKGAWSLIEEGGKTWIVLDEAFSTKKAPDLKLFLSPHAGAKLSGKNATDQAVLIAELKSHKGGQKYAIPSGVDLSKFTTLALHCEQYSKLWAVAPLP